MAIFKAKPANPFTQIPNSTLQDTSLSFEAKGLLVLILSLPEDWEIHKSWLQKQTPKCGQDKLKRLLKELTDTGYMVKKAKQSEDGKLAGWDWFVYPEKQLEPSKTKGSTVGVKNRPTVSPIDGKTRTTNKHINKQTSKSVNNARADVFSLDKIVIALHEIGMPKNENWYAEKKAQEYMERFPDSVSVADACRYVVNAIDHAWKLEGKKSG